MSKNHRTGGNGNDLSSFDVSALLNFMKSCRLMEAYVNDFRNVKQIIQVG